MDCLWFYRPLYWDSGFWHFRIYGRYPHRDWFYFEQRTIVVTYTGGGHCWRTHGSSWYCGRTYGHPDRIGSGGCGMRNNWNGQGHRYTSSSQTNGHRSSNSLSSGRGSGRGSFSGQQSTVNSQRSTNSLSSGRGLGRGSFSGGHSGGFSGGHSSGSFSGGRSGGGHGGFSGGHSSGGRR